MNGPYFSVTHTKKRLYIAFSDAEIGLDAESILRAPYYETIVQKFSPAEQAEIDCAEAFLKHWVVKESAVKYMGGTLAMDLYKLSYEGGQVFYDGKPFDVTINLLRHEEFILSVCGNTAFDNVEFIPLETL
jgi:phosphopantetheinyl transferase